MPLILNNCGGNCSRKGTKMSEEYKVTLKATYDDGEFHVTIPLYEIVDEMSDEQKLDLAEHVTWGAILREAKLRLTDRARGFSSKDWVDKLDFIEAVEDKLISGYRWGMLRELKRACSNIASHKQLYYMMYHDEQYGDFFREWMKINHIDSPYDKFESVEEFTAFVDDWFKKLANTKKGVETCNAPS